MMQVARDLLAGRRSGIGAMRGLQHKLDALDTHGDSQTRGFPLPFTSPISSRVNRVLNGMILRVISEAERDGLQAQIKSLRGKTEGYTLALLALARKLEEAENKIEDVLAETREKVHIVRQAQSRGLLIVDELAFQLTTPLLT